jgi:hypothetical protein
MSKLFLGIDPGVHGGLSIIKIADGAARVLVNSIDVPVVGAELPRAIDVDR